MRGADVIVKAFEAAGVTNAFAVVGSTIAPIVQRMDATSTFRYINTRHEQVAASMADAYGRVTRRPAVTMGHASPGASNLIIGVVTAFRDSVPMVVITGNEDRPHIGKDSWQEFDVLSVFRPITKWSIRIERPEDIAYVLRNALLKSVSGRPAPVHIDIPRDVQEAEVDDDQVASLNFGEGPLRVPLSRSAPDSAAVEAAVAALGRAQRPVILAGGGVLASGAEDALRQLAELLECPVIGSLTSRGALPEDHPLALGVSGAHGNKAAERALGEADVILAVGNRLSDLQTKGWTLIPSGATLIQVNIEGSEIGRNYAVAIPIVADARAALQAMSEGIRHAGARPPADASGRMRELKQAQQAELQAFMDAPRGEYLTGQEIIQAVMRARKRDAVITHGAGGHTLFGNKIPVLEPRTHLKAIGSAAMGFAFPATLGTKVAFPDRQTIAIVGDGDFMMVAQDIETAVRERLNPVIIVFNNYGLGGGGWAGAKHSNPDFGKFSELFGGNGAQVRTVPELEQALDRMLRSERIGVIDAVMAENTVAR